MLRRTKSSHLFQFGYFSPLTFSSRKIIFSDIYCEDLVEFLEVKFTKVWRPLWATLEFLTLRLSTLSFQQTVNYTLGFSTLIMVPIGVSAGGVGSVLERYYSLYPPVFLSSFRDSNLSCDFTSLINLRFVYFPACSAFCLLLVLSSNS